MHCKTRGEGFGAEVVRRIMLGTYALSRGARQETYQKAKQVRHLVCRAYREIFGKVDAILGPEMRSTGEVMGIDDTFGRAFFKAELAAGNGLPESGTVFLSVNDHDKPAGLVVAQ